MEQKLLTKSVLCATEQGYKAELRDYISRGVVGVVDEEGSTPLMYAAANGREEVVRLLLDEKVGMVTPHIPSHLTPALLHHATLV